MCVLVLVQDVAVYYTGVGKFKPQLSAELSIVVNDILV